MKFKVGDIVSPKLGTEHLRTYGNFIAKITDVDEYRYRFTTIEEGNGDFPISKSSAFFTTRFDVADVQLEINRIYDTPLWKALE